MINIFRAMAREALVEHLNYSKYGFDCIRNKTMCRMFINVVGVSVLHQIGAYVYFVLFTLYYSFFIINYYDI